jgi:hypothetical protein
MRQQLIFFQTIIYLSILGLCTLCPWSLAANADVTVDASLSHLSFPQDKAAMLTITVTGTSKNSPLELPEIDNIYIHSQGSSSQISVINGAISSSISHNYLVQATQPGAYTIPPIKVTAGRKTYATEPIPFQVTPAGQEPSGNSGATDQARDNFAFIRISETGSHYPGEIVPFTIKAYFTQAYRADINSLPTLHGDGVVMSQLQEKPEQTEELVKGKKYHVLTWNTSLSGIKAGDHPISFSLDATLLIPQKRRSLSPFGNSRFFADSFFDDPAIDSLFGNSERRPIVSVSPEVVFKVLPLPTDEQPANFTGAIGDFDMAVSAKPVNVEIGEPMTLTMEISGIGNFDRVEAPVFPDSPDWKIYSPSATFLELGSSYNGIKTFEQAIVARNGAITSIPPLSFSYFDPGQKRYVTKTSEAVPIHMQRPATVTSGTQAVQQVVQPQSQPVAEDAAAAAITGLAPIHLQPGTYHDRIVPLITKSWFIALCILCIVMLLAILTFRIRQRTMAKHPEILHQRQKRERLDYDLKNLEEALAQGDGRTFLFLSKTAIQNQLGPLWNIEPAALSLADIKNRLQADSHLIEIFSAADEAAYAGAGLTEKKMQAYCNYLKTELLELL